MGRLLATTCVLILAATACTPARRGVTAARGDAAGGDTGKGSARAVILLIGDGLGDSEITMARNYHVGAAGRLALDRLPFTGSLTTYTLQESNPKLPDYVGDSAATATAWATGHRTSNGRVSTAAGSGAAMPTILELAQAAGYATGSVTTAEVTDATPAALVAHVSYRRCQGPADMAPCERERAGAGGRGSIAEQIAHGRADVLLGGGRSRFEQVIDGGPESGRTPLDTAAARGFTVVTDAAGLAALQKAGGAGSPRVLGLFAADNMTLEWKGDPAAAFPGSGPQRCVEGLRPSGEPSLAEMTRAAIALLERASPRGFFLQVEGASIDKSAHAGDPCGQIGETVAFDAAVAAAVEYARLHPDTLVVVTGDHGHSGQIVPIPSPERHGPGGSSTLLTADGAKMTVAYATNGAGLRQDHSGTQIRVAAIGPGAATLSGVHEQTDLFRLVAGALGLTVAAGE